MSLSINELIPILKDITYVGEAFGVRAAHEKYIGYDHPEIDYNIAVIALQNGYTDIGKERLISCVKQGISPPYQWMHTIHSNAIGQCCGLLLTRELMQTSDQEVIAKLFVYGYLNLSSCIGQIGLRAYESYEMRARMFLECDFITIVLNYFNRIGISPDLVGMLNAYDLYQSSLGFHSINPRKSEELSERVIRLVNNFSANVATVESLSEFIESAAPIQQIIYEKLSGFTRMGVTIEGKIE